MSTHTVELHHDSNSTDVFVTNERVEPEGSYMLFKFTSEGLVIDHVSEDGNILASSCQMYDEIADTLQ